MFSLKYRLVEHALKKMHVKQMFQKTGDEFWQNILDNNRNGNTSAPPSKLYKRLEIEDRMIGAKHVYTARSRKAKGDKKILYIHGGGFVIEAQDFHWGFVKYLIDKTVAEVVFPQYPLAPENSCIDAISMLLELYRDMLGKTNAEKIVIMGDSAGGAIALSLAMEIRKTGLSQPGHIVMISPGVQAVPETPEDEARLGILEEKDIMISSVCLDTITERWRGKFEPTNYRMSPLHGDLRGLSQMTVFSGTGEILNMGARKLKDVADEQGVDLEYIEKEDMMHCWLLMPFAEAKNERKIIVDIISAL